MLPNVKAVIVFLRHTARDSVALKRNLRRTDLPFDVTFLKIHKGRRVADDILASTRVFYKHERGTKQDEYTLGNYLV